MMSFHIYFKSLLFLAVVVMLSACGSKDEAPLKVAINPWPGYEFLYLAEQQGFFKQVGLNAELVQLGSLADAQRAYLNGQVDGFTSTVIEAVQASALGKKPLKIVMVPDFSNGGDVIVTGKNIASIKDLKGLTVGCEVSSLGIFLLQRALAKAGLSLNDVKIKNVEQNIGKETLFNGDIDAFVTYPPVSIDILKNDQMHTIFSSAEIPKEIIDTVAISKRYLDKHPSTVEKFMKAWQMALDFYETNEDLAVSIMAKREGISSEDFKGVLSDLKILDSKAQRALFDKPDLLQNSVTEVCNTLNHMKSIDSSCDDIEQIVYGVK